MRSKYFHKHFTAVNKVPSLEKFSPMYFEVGDAEAHFAVRLVIALNPLCSHYYIGNNGLSMPYDVRPAMLVTLLI